MEAEITEIPLSGRFSVGPFEVELVTITHSIPEPNAVVIRTPLGAVLHTGDWKLDPDPLIGPTSKGSLGQRHGSSRRARSRLHGRRGARVAPAARTSGAATQLLD